MKLSLGIIADRMRPKYSCRLYGHADEALSRNRPRLYRPGSEMTGGELYLGTTEALQQAEIPEDVALICVGGHIPPRWSARELPVLSVSGDVVEVFEAVQAIFDSFDAWDYAMLSELAKGEDMDIRRLIFLGSEGESSLCVQCAASDAFLHEGAAERGREPAFRGASR